MLTGDYSTYALVPLCIEERDRCRVKISYEYCLSRDVNLYRLQTDDSELDRHENTQEMEENLEHRPFASLHQTPCSRRKNQSIPSCDCQSADEEIFVSAEMGR